MLRLIRLLRPRRVFSSRSPKHLTTLLMNNHTSPRGPPPIDCQCRLQILPSSCSELRCPASVPLASASATTQPLQPDPPPPLQRLEPILRATPIARDARPQDDTQLHQRQKQAVPVDRQPALPNRNFRLQLKSTRHLGRRVNLETQITPLLRNHPDVQSAISLA